MASTKVVFANNFPITGGTAMAKTSIALAELVEKGPRTASCASSWGTSSSGSWRSRSSSAAGPAGYGERSDDRSNSRNGYRERRWETRAGTLNLRIPKLRQGKLLPRLP